MPYLPEHGFALYRGKEYVNFEVEGPAFSLMEGKDRILLCMGVMPIHHGVGKAWTMMTPHITRPDVSYGLFRAIRRNIEKFAKDHQLHRIEADVVYENEVAHAWIKSLGFMPEGLMLKYSPLGESCVRYARIF